jgi:signal transduction histidine kinase
MPEELTVTGEKRRNLFLVFKELLHNTVKYSGVREVAVHVHVQDEIRIAILEIGSAGFDPDTAKDRGNGLYNCRKRMDTIHGDIRYEKSDAGMTMTLTAPIKS